MAEIAYILLCHRDPGGIVAQAERLTSTGDYVAIHFDARAKRQDFLRIRDALAANPRVAFTRRRIKCGWGEWSLVAATLLATEAAVTAFPRATHFYMLSGDCMPIKPARYIHDFLDADDCDYIESFDFFGSDWIKTGLKEERLIYRHFFNERASKRLFYASLDLQQRLGLTRDVPADLQVMIGSQWWCLRRRTIESVLDFCRRRPEVVRFFRTTWIPDETFFQTVVRHLVPTPEIRTRTLTFLMFSDYGMPVTFYNDHYDLLRTQDCLFARKISPHATDLRRRLGELYLDDGATFDLSDEGRRLHQFLTGRGRIGRRFAPRAWESGAGPAHDSTLMIIACKKWHVAKRLVARIRQNTGLPAVEYLFNEEATPLPDLGGIESTLAKRGRHRGSVLRMLFSAFGSDRLVICLDTSDFDTMRDFYNGRGTVRLLEIECDFTDDYLIGHAQRVGLAGDRTTPGMIDTILPTVRYDVRFESDRIRESGLPNLFRMRQAALPEENAVPLAAFLGIPVETARSIAATDHLFSD